MRSEVWRIDKEIIRLIHRRTCLAEAILEAKVSQGLAIEDRGQEKLVIERAVNRASELSLESQPVEEIFWLLIEMSRQRQRELLRRDVKGLEVEDQERDQKRDLAE